MSEVLELDGCTVDLHERCVLHERSRVSLTSLEVRVLRFLWARRGEIVSRAQLEQEVWGFAPGVQSEAVPVAMRRIRKRLEQDPRRPRNLFTERGLGWRLGAPRLAAQAPPGLWGRDELLASIEAAWARHPIQTLTGPGGCGKSVAARASLPSATVVPLAEVDTREAWGEAVRRALQLEAADDVPRIVQAALSRGVHLLFDDADAVVDLVRGVLAEVPSGARVLVTCRRPLKLRDERVWSVPPLAARDAAALFLHHYRRVGGEAPLDSEEVVTMVDYLGGHPLAIELTAPHARLLPLTRIRDRLEQRGLDSFEDPQRDARHASIAACLASTHAVLQPPALEILGALSLLPNGLSFDEIEAFLGSDPLKPLEDLVETAMIGRQGRRFIAQRLVRTYWRARAVGETYGARVAKVVASRLRRIAEGPRPFRHLAGALGDLLAVAPFVGTTERRLVLDALAGARLGGAHLPAVRACLRALPPVGDDPRLAFELATVACDQLDLDGAAAIIASVRPCPGVTALDIADVRRRLAKRGSGTGPTLEDAASWPCERPLDHLHLANLCWDAGQTERAREELYTAIGWAERTRDVYVAVRARIILHILEDQHDTTPDGRLLNEALGLAEEAGLVHLALHIRGLSALLCGDAEREQMEEHLAGLEEDLVAMGKHAHASWVRVNRVLNQWYLGNPQVALQLYHPELRLNPLARAMCTAIVEAARLQCGRGSVPALEQALDELAPKLPVRFLELPDLIRAIVLDAPLPWTIEALEAVLPNRSGDVRAAYRLWTARQSS